jgi:nitroreductase
MNDRLPESWYQAIFNRKSHRSFHPRALEEDKIVRLEKICREFRPFAGVRAEFIRRSPDRVFRGVLADLGKITGASFYIAFIGSSASPGVAEGIGYTGEGVILEATTLGLGTCWVSGFFRPDAVKDHLALAEGERIFAVTPIGYSEREMTAKDKIYRTIAGSQKRKSMDKIAEGPIAERWQEKALEAARLAPSAANRQPWRFVVGANSIKVCTDGPKDSDKYPKRLDCGIAMLHLELGAQAAGGRGKWTRLDPPDVALFEVLEK